MSENRTRPGRSSVATPAAVLIALYVAAALQYLRFASRLPDQVAVHFAGDGSPNGWSSRSTFFLVYAIVLGVSGLLWLAIFAMLRADVGRINLPNRGYWLAPERRELTVSYLRRWFLWFGAVLTGVLVGSFELVMRANTRPLVRLDNQVFHQLFIPFIVFCVVWASALIFRFRAPRGAQP